MNSIKCSHCGLRQNFDNTFCKNCQSDPSANLAQSFYVRSLKPFDYLKYSAILLVFLILFGGLFAYKISTRSRIEAMQSETENLNQESNQKSQYKVSFTPESVKLNYSTKQMEFRGVLKNEGDKIPSRVWLWAYFFSPLSETDGSWSGSPIEIQSPFVSGNEYTIFRTEHFHWWDNPFTPKSSWYARVNVSAESEDKAIVPTETRNKTTAGAISVDLIR